MLQTGTQYSDDRVAFMCALLNIVDDGSIVRCGKRLVLGQDVEALRRIELRPVDGRVVLDLSQVEIMDAAGIGALVDLHVRVTEMGAELVLLNPHPNVHDVLRMTRLDSVFTICSLQVAEASRPAAHAA